ncbi:MAG TPA: NAD(P)-dependent oxidoreductase [Ignavibacteriales bacterium]|nr:NAD(P)-dependent oxidoreductase [Ignavibacteriales bacterium]
MKILLTGASGFLGSALMKKLSATNDVLGIYSATPVHGAVQADIMDFAQMEKTVNDFGPDIIIHTAAISRVDAAENMPRDIVMDINVISTQNIAEICANKNIKLIYTSTDLVYSGNEGGALQENAKLDPASFYAETKLMGEIAIRNTFDNYIILRTALLYGLHSGTNFFGKMFEALKNGNEVKLFHDQFRSPLSVIEAAGMILELSKRDIKGEIINFGGLERLSRLDMGTILCEEAGFDPKNIIKTSIYDMKDVPVVPDVSMDSEKLDSLGIKRKGFRESLKNILKIRGLD